MKMKLYTLGFGLAATLTLLIVAPVQAASKYGCIYVVDASGELVRDPFGNCVRTPFWTPDQEIPECGGVVAAVEPPPTPVIETITLGADAYFDFDKATLKPEGRARLDDLAQDLRRVESVRSIEVVGHTDSIGTEAYNQDLSERRAATVRDYLISRGVSPSLITAYGRGESQPIAPNTLPSGQDNPAGRAQNRRVEITVEASQQVMR